jgi:hypothetical protein
VENAKEPVAAADDAAANVVVFEVEVEGRLETRTGQGPTRAGACIRQVWTDLSAKEPLRRERVRRIYSEWEPSAEDRAFLEATFPKGDGTHCLGIRG